MQFTATVACDVVGQCNTGVTWSVDTVAGGNAIDGTIASSGSYIAPTTVPSGGNVTVKAVGSDNSTSGAVTVKVTQARVLVAYTNTTAGSCNNGAGCSSTNCDYGYGCNNIYVFDLASPTAGTKLMVQSSYQYSSLAISPDHSTIAYLASPVAEFAPLYALSAYTVPITGGDPTTASVLNSANGATGIDWKPDGSGFAINYYNEQNKVSGIET